MGQAIAPLLYEVRVFDHNETALLEMQRTLPNIKYILGDIRDRARLREALKGVDVVIHCAALQHISMCEDNISEAVKTNIQGSLNVADLAIEANVKKVLGISSDKAVNPFNAYGVTKSMMEKIFLSMNDGTRFSCVRFGNFRQSQGNVIPLIIQQAKQGEITITDYRMKRFWIDIGEAAAFAIRCVQMMKGGEIFIPKMIEEGIMDIVNQYAPNAKHKIIGRRKGEKLRETLWTSEESVKEMGDYYVINDHL